MTTNPTAKGQRTQIPGPQPASIPALPTAVKDAKATRELLFTLRHFHLGEPTAKDQLEAAPDDILPALLDPFRDTAKLRYDYPLFLFPPGDGDGHQDADDLEQPLAEWFTHTVRGFAPGDDSARILKDHLHWLEYHLRQTLREREGPAPATLILRGAGLDLQHRLSLDQENRERLQADLDRLQAAAGEGQIMGYGRYPALHLLIHAVRSRVIPRLARFQSQVDQSIQGLRALFDVEWGKSDEAIEPRQARDSVGPEGQRFDPAALSAVMDHSKGTQAMPPERRERIQRALEILEAWRPDPIRVRFIHLGKVGGHWLSESNDTKDLVDPDPCARATELFDREAAKLADTFAAVRIAQLEIKGIYDPAIHDPWFENFQWEAFSQEELLLVPSIIALDDADRVAGSGLQSFSRLLSSGRPVQIMIRILAHNNPGARPDENPFQAYRTELGYLGISHRQAVVTQSSAARHRHLMRCFLDALDATHTSLNLITTGIRPPGPLVRLNAWLVAGAGIEGRAHPFFRINPAAGDFAAARMDFSETPKRPATGPYTHSTTRTKTATASRPNSPSPSPTTPSSSSVCTTTSGSSRRAATPPPWSRSPTTWPAPRKKPIGSCPSSGPWTTTTCCTGSSSPENSSSPVGTDSTSGTPSRNWPASATPTSNKPSNAPRPKNGNKPGWNANASRPSMPSSSNKSARPPPARPCSGSPTSCWAWT